MAGYFYRGRHRKPTRTARQTAALAVAGATVALPLTQGAAYAAAPDWGPIIQCESGGNPTARNASSSASGLYQFITGTWRAYGGDEFAPVAALATVAEQTIVANRAYAAEGFQPWNASRSCWAGSSDSSASASATPAPTTRAVTPSRAADGAGTYVCDRAHVHFEACDPENFGEAVDYPRYDTPAARPAAQPPAATPTPAPSSGVYTIVPGDTLSEIAHARQFPGGWPALYERNREVVGGNPHLIFPGQQLDL